MHYSSLSPFSYVGDSPIQGFDPDGKRILFVNGYWNSTFSRFGLPRAPGRPYWGGALYLAAAQEFLNDYSQISDEFFIDGSSLFGGDMSGRDRYKAGEEYAKKNISVLTQGLQPGEVFNIITHSEGSAFGAGVAHYLLRVGYRVKTVVHLSADEPNEFSTPPAPTTYQLEYAGDLVIGEQNWLGGVENLAPIRHVDFQGTVLRHDLNWSTVHGASKWDTRIFDALRDLRTVRTDESLGMDPENPSKGLVWIYQRRGTTKFGTEFTEINGRGIRNSNGTLKR